MLYSINHPLSVSLPSRERVLRSFVGRERGGTRRVARINRAFFIDVFHPPIAAIFGSRLELRPSSGSNRSQSTLLLLPVQEYFSSRQDLLSWIGDSSMSRSKSLISELPRDRVPANILGVIEEKESEWKMSQ